MKFCTAVNCMDGRTQRPVVEFMKARYGAEYVDMITEPGPNRILAEQEPRELVDSICRRIDISVHHHGSRAIGVVGHHECAGNPAGRRTQRTHLRKAAAFLADKYPGADIVAIWVNADWQAEEEQLAGD